MNVDILKFMDSLDYEGKTFTRFKEGSYVSFEDYPVKEWFLKQVNDADKMKYLNEKDVVFYKGNQWWFHIEHKENKITNYTF